MSLKNRNNIFYILFKIYAWIQELPKVYPKVVTLVQAGSTYEKRPIMGVKVSFKDVPQKTVFIEANIHAREWYVNYFVLHFIFYFYLHK